MILRFHKYQKTQDIKYTLDLIDGIKNIWLKKKRVTTLILNLVKPPQAGKGEIRYEEKHNLEVGAVLKRDVSPNSSSYLLACERGKIVRLQNIEYQDILEDLMTKRRKFHCPDQPMRGKVGSKSGKISLQSLAEV